MKYGLLIDRTFYLKLKLVWALITMEKNGPEIFL